MPKASQPSVEAQSSVAAPVSGAITAAVCAKLGDGEWRSVGRGVGRACGVAAAQRLPQLWSERIVGKAAAFNHDGVKVR